VLLGASDAQAAEVRPGVPTAPQPGATGVTWGSARAIQAGRARDSRPGWAVPPPGAVSWGGRSKWPGLLVPCGSPAVPRALGLSSQVALKRSPLYHRLDGGHASSAALPGASDAPAAKVGQAANSVTPLDEQNLFYAQARLVHDSHPSA